MAIPARVLEDPERGYREWGIWEIYTGPNGTGSFIPNVNDAVRDWERGFFRVSAVDPTTKLSTLIPWSEYSRNTGLSAGDILVGSGPGTQSDSWRVYIDTRARPYALEVDRRLQLYGSEVKYVKVFKGYNTSTGGTVISEYVDAVTGGETENIPLERVPVPTGSGTYCSTPVSAYATEALTDGEVVTVVPYTTAGTPIGFYTMIVRRTNLVRRTDAQRKQITNIRLDSSYLSETEPGLLRFPVGTLIGGVVLRCIVDYSDGTTRTVSVSGSSGSSTSLYGFSSVETTVAGSVYTNLVLNYIPQSTEYVNAAEVSVRGTVTKSYSAVIDPQDDTYNVKLFGYPVKVNGAWTLQFYLYSLDRIAYYKVDPAVVEYADDTTLDSTLLNVDQRITVTVNLNDISSRFREYRHTQTLTVQLKGVASGTTGIPTYWTVRQTPSDLVYGSGMGVDYTTSGGKHYLNFGSNQSNATNWITYTRNRVGPLRDTRVETELPAVTHFYILKPNNTSIGPFAIAESYNDTIEYGSAVANGSTIFVRLVNVTTTDTKEIAMVAFNSY